MILARKKSSLVFTLSDASGFTLVELLIVLGIMLVLAGVGTMNLYSNAARQNLDQTTKVIVATLRDAQARSMTAESGSAWGVRFDNASAARYYGLAKASGGTLNVGGFISKTLLNKSLVFDLDGADIKDVVFNSISGKPYSGADAIIKIGLVSSPAIFHTITVFSNGRVAEE